MAERSHGTGISWTHLVARDGAEYKGETWNPVTGCTRVSTGCDNCYAFAFHDTKHAQNRDAFRAWRKATYAYPQDGPQSLMLAREMGFKPPWPPQYDKPFSTVQLLPERLDVPLRAKKPRCYFVDSMGDLFHEEVPDDYLDQVFATMALSPQHIFQVLTKRPERMPHYVTADRWRPVRSVMKRVLRENLPLRRRLLTWPIQGDGTGWPLPNVWLGTSAEDQRALDERLPHLLNTPAAVRFVSAEPLLGPIDFTAALGESCWDCDGDGHVHGYDSDGNDTEDCERAPVCTCCDGKGRHGGLDWIIVGGESGERRREMSEAWARSILDQGRAAAVAVYMKQVSARRPGVPFAGDLDVREWPI